MGVYQGFAAAGGVRARESGRHPAAEERVHYNKNTLVLDLDETLVHSNLEQTLAEADFSFPVNFNNQQHIVNVRKRLPDGVHGIAARHFEVVVLPRRRRCTRSDC